MTLSPGQLVRLRHNPAKAGTLSDRTKQLGERLYRYVQFPSGFEYVPEDQLESAAIVLDPHDLLAAGTLSSARDLRRVLTHARLSGRLADYLYSLETTRTDYYPHQFKPVLRLLTTVGEGILIADEVGLGKTIEAGLIWTELRTRFEYRRLFVVCPAVLREKWREELATRFGVRAELCDAGEALDRLRSAARDSTGESFAVIGSMQGLRPRGDGPLAATTASPSQKLAAFLSEREGEPPLIDLLVIDEAHHMRNTDTATSKLGRLLRTTANHTVLLTATPVNLSSDDLFSLVQLLDRDTFVNVAEFQSILEANAPLVEARKRILDGGLSRVEFVQLIERALEHTILKGSQTLAEMRTEPPSDEELCSNTVRADLAHQLDQANLLGQVINRTRKREVQEHRVERKAVPQAVEMSPTEWEFYERVTAIVRDYCKHANASEGFLLTMPQRLMASSIPAAFRHWGGHLPTQQGELLGGVEDEDDEDVEGPDEPAPLSVGSLVQEIMQRVQGLGPYAALRAGDSKYALLVKALRAYLAEFPDAKIVLFSSFRATLAYLGERLRDDGIPSLTMTGDTSDKQALIETFRMHSGSMVLLSSEVGSEGVDLQFSRVIVNYDLPWNPMRVEQRIGRLDRLGQRAETVTIWNLFCARTIDERIYERLYRRIGIFEHALGGLEPILGGQIRDLTWELLRDKLTPEQESRRIDEAAQAFENRRKIEQDIEDNASQFFALGDYLLEQVKTARELGRRVTDDDLMNYVVEFIRQHHPDCEVTRVDGDPLRLGLRLSPEAKVGLERFIRERRIAAHTRLTVHSGAPIPCRFKNIAVDTQAGGTETVNQVHPLVRYAREVLERTESNLRLAIAGRIATSALAGHVPPGNYMFAVDRWSVQGVQVMERLAYSAVNLASGERLEDDDAERLVNNAAALGRDWLTAASEVDLEAAARGPGAACLGELESRFSKYERTVRLQNEDRADALVRTLEKQVEGQIARIQQTIDEQVARGQTGLVAANRARIDRLRERADMRRIRYSEGAKTTTERTLFLMGLIEVAAGGNGGQ